MLTFLQLYGAITGSEYQKMNEYTKEQSERIRKELINSDDYLNNEYYDCLFNDNERAMICETDHGKIFLLSAEEARTYFADDADRIAGSNRYNRDYYLLRDLSNNWNGGYRWRMYVNNVGAIIDDNVDGRFGIRPAMWLDMDKAVS